MATFGLHNGGPYWPLAAFQFLMFWCILVDSCSSSISFWHFSHFHALPECGPYVSKCCGDWTWQIKRLRQPSSVAWGDCWSVRETPRRGGLSIVIGANLVTMTSPLHLWAEFGRFVCLCLLLTGPISPHSRSRCGPESSRATTALGRGQLRQSRFEQTRTCLRTLAMSCY